MVVQLQSNEGSGSVNNDSKLFLDALRGLQHTCLSLASQIGVVLDLADRPLDSVEEGTCRHPPQRRLPAPAMGHPNRFFCQECNQEVEE